MEATPGLIGNFIISTGENVVSWHTKMAAAVIFVRDDGVSPSPAKVGRLNDFFCFFRFS